MIKSILIKATSILLLLLGSLPSVLAEDTFAHDAQTYKDNTHLSRLNVDSRCSGYSAVKWVACINNFYANTDTWSTTVSINSKVIFILTDLLGTPVVETDSEGNEL